MGQTTAQWLIEVQIETISDLEQVGVVEAYQRVKALYPERVSVNLLYALQAGLLGIKWTMLPQELKEALQAQIDNVDGRAQY
ncbi:TfoX/Sxy family protein [Chloroflexi bacterium TSY]|nr:TfoX/Sxy family protein [Chloroflexi bacterium TSY]